MKTGLPNLLGAAIRDYFTDHLPRLRGTSPHTIHSYRDSMVLLLRFPFPTTEQADYGARPDGSRSSRNPRVPVPS